MFRIHFITALRTILKNRGVALINVVGLTMGLTAFLFIAHYLFYELSFDSFFPGSDSVYRVNMDILNGKENFYHGSKTSRGLYFSCIKDVPGIEANGDAYYESCLIRYNTSQLAQQRVLWVDEGIEKVFRFKLIKGSIDFARPFAAIISKSKVSAVFGTDDPIGRIMKVNEGMPVEITGVYDDLPSNTHLTADYFISLKTWEHYNWIRKTPDWNYNGYWNYIKLAPGVSTKVMEETLSGLVNANINRRNNQRTAKIFLQPLSDLHYLRGLEGEMGSQTNQKSLILLLVIALLTILIAWINYVNLATAVSSKRADEIGLRKLIGASGFHLWLQSFIETLILNLLAVLLSFILYRTFLFSFEKYFEIPFTKAVFNEKYVIWSLSGISLIGIIFASLYNSFSLMKLNPFSGKRNVRGSSTFQKGMVIAQMALSIVFISATMVVYKQISFMKKADLGINFDRVITLNAPASLNIDTAKRRRYTSFREDLLQFPEFKSVTANSFTPGQSPRYGYVEYVRPDAGIHPNILFFENTADDGLVQTFELNLLAGTGFSPITSQNKRKVILNEKSIKELGFKNPMEAVGKNIFRTNRDTIPIEIIGVLGDFHNEGLQKPIYPIIYNNGHPGEFGYYSIKLNTPDVNKALTNLKKTWTSHYHADPIDYFFADEFFFRQYQSETRFARFYIVLTVLSISIACLGLYGLIMFYLSQKRKEIGIRKINGARVAEVMLMLNKEFVIWVLVAFIIAVPVVWYIMNRWLLNYAYRTDLSWWLFALSGFLALTIALMTVSWQSWRAATRNPVEALRYE